MNLPDIPLLGLLRERMSYLDARQSVLSQNVANADSPGYAAQDVKPLGFDELLRRANGGDENNGSMMLTDPRHIAPPADISPKFESAEIPDGAADATGNTVSLEQEMIKVADNQAQFQAASNLYAKTIDLLRTAIGRPQG
jgi:flagellar basal-body rod protein FlgB